MAQQVVTELVIDARSAAAGAAAYEGAMKKAEAAAQRVVAVNDNAQAAIERSTVSMSQSTSRQATAWQRMAAAADPVIAATQRLEKATIAGNAAMARGVASADEVAATLAIYRAQLDAASAASVRGTAATALNSGQVQNLTFQLNDMATMLASGQSPFVMLMQQGMQMAQVFGPGVGVGGAMKATGAALLSFITNPLTLAVAGLAAAAGAVSLLWDAVSSSSSAEDALERQKALIEDIRDTFGEAGEAATAYAAKSASVLQFRTADAMAANAAALQEALGQFEQMFEPRLGILMADFGALNPLVQEFTQSIRDGTADVAGFEKAVAAVGNATDDVQTDAAVAEVLALIDPLLQLERQARQTAGATQLFAGTLVTLGRSGTLRFADAFGDLESMRGDLTGFLNEQNRAAEESARIAAQRADAIKNVADELTFEADQLARTAREQAIYNALRQAGTTLDSAAGRDIAALAGRLYDAEQAQDALNDRLKEAKGLAAGFANTLISGLMQGKGIVSSLGSAISGMSSTFGDMAGGFLGKIGGGGIFGSILSGLGGGLVSSLVSGIGGLIDSIFGGNDEEERAARQLRRQERRDKIEARKERLEEKEEKRLARQEARARRMEGYSDRAFTAGLDTSTMEGRLAQFDLEAQREREAVIRAGGKKVNQELAALDAALAAERLQIQRDFNDEMIADAKAAADELNRVALSIVDYVNGLRAGSGSPLSPQDQFSAAQSAFQSQLALAQGGNASALGSITQYSDAYLKAAREMYASSQDFFTIFDTVTAQLLALPTVQNATDPAVAAMLDVLAAVQAQTTVLQAQTTTLAGAIDAGPTATANALAPLFDTIDVDVSGGITQAEMAAALGTTNDRLAAIFTELDVNGNGTISRLELLAKDTSIAGLAKDATVAPIAQIPAINTGIGSVNAGIDNVNTNVGKNDESGLKRWTKNGALASRTTAEWQRVLAGRLYEISLFSSQAKGAKGKPIAGDDRTVFSAKGNDIKRDQIGGQWAQGGMIPGLASGGMVGNGRWNVDSVRARYAGGGEIMLAGGEFVTRAPSVNAMTMPILDAINRTGRVSGMGANDNGRYFADQNRVLMAGFRAMIETLQSEVSALRAEVRRSGGDVARAVKDKPVAKPATKAA